jgi:hypothetical protein
MGAWGTGTFENDDASDWLFALEGTTDHALLESALRAAATPQGYLEAPTCCEALAAAEVVASLRGWPSSALPPEVSQWVSAHRGAPAPALTALATQAIDRIERDSELRDLWADSDENSDWLRAIAELRRRLAADTRVPLGPGRAVAIGHAVISLPSVVVLLGISWLTWEHSPVGALIGVLIAWLWWAFAVPRWRHWALAAGADPNALQRWGQSTGLIWPRGWIFEKTEIPYRPDTEAPR